MGLHGDELTEGCSGISHCETRGSGVRRTRLGRARETWLTEGIGSEKDVGFFPEESSKPSHTFVGTSIRNPMVMPSRIHDNNVYRHWAERYLVVGEQFIHGRFPVNGWGCEVRNSVTWG